MRKKKKSKMSRGMEAHEKSPKLKRKKLLAEEGKRQKKEKKERNEKKCLDPSKWDKVNECENKKLEKQKTKNNRIKEQRARQSAVLWATKTSASASTETRISRNLIPWGGTFG